MGLCFSLSSLLSDENLNQGSQDGLPMNSSTSTAGAAIPLGPSKPFSRKPKRKYKTETPLSPRQLTLKREQFWDTAPKYSGREEVWQALKLVCESRDDGDARAIIDSLGIVLPTGLLSDGAFDEWGNRYVIPEYCFVEPSNLLKESTKDLSGSSQNVAARNDESEPITVTLRLSNQNQGDIRIHARKNYGTEKLRRALIEKDSSFGNTKMRFIHLGRVLSNSDRLGNVFPSSADACVLQVMISPLE